MDRKELLTGVLNDVLEKLAFMFGSEAAPDEVLASDSGYMMASMGFSGPFNGTLALAVVQDMCPELAANILGVEPYDDRVMEKAQDALKELLNITCGHVLTALAGDDPVFDLTIPVVNEMDDRQWEAMAQGPTTATVMADEFPVLLEMRIDGEV